MTELNKNENPLRVEEKQMEEHTIESKSSVFGIIGHILTYFFLCIWALTTIFPLLWTTLNSFKPRNKILSDSFALPIGKIFTLDNYTQLFDQYDIAGAYARSLIISFSVAIAVLFRVCKVCASPEPALPKRVFVLRA